MCGICGVFEYGMGAVVGEEQLRRMNRTLVHRGPDEEGFFLRPHVGLGARRLSIIDLAGSHQPVANEDGSIVAVFNGEIYNYRQLREELQRKGHVLKTRGDTEVIPHLYEEYGPACVEHLDGMFAFALFDGRKGAVGSEATRPGTLLLFRDRLGKKPLYYADLGGSLIFGSELKPVLCDPRVGKQLDLQALHHYLSLQVVPAPYSIFKSVRKLPPGCFLQCDGTGVRVRRYWDYLEHLGSRPVSEEEAVAEIRELLRKAVKKRLVADVPLGAFLSGGLDSSAVVALMSRLQDGPVKTFSIGFEGPQIYDELEDARLLANHCRTDHHEVMLRPNSIEVLEETVRYADEPFAISSAIPLLLLSRWAREKVTVVLTGDGGDEVFAGYNHYTYERWLAAYRMVPAFVDKLLVGSAAALGGKVDSATGVTRRRILRLVTQARRSVGQRRVGWAASFDEGEKLGLYADHKAHQSLQTTASFLDDRIAGRNGGDPATNINAVDMLVMLADEMLTKVDRMTMAASLEARSPLLDWRLVEYMAGIPLWLKAPGWRRSGQKHLLRRAVADLLPPALLQKPKHGFGVPVDLWFRGGARDYLQSVLCPERVRRRGLFSAEVVSLLVSRHLASEINATNRLFALLTFEVWADSYL